MPARKGARGRRSLARQTITTNVPCDVSFPSVLSDQILRLYYSNSDVPAQPAKRQRTETDGRTYIDALPIIRERLAICRPRAKSSSDTSHLVLPDSQSSLTFKLATTLGNDEPDGLGFRGNPAIVISPRPSSKLEPFSLTFPLGPTAAISDTLAAILNSRDVLWSESDIEDAVWISVEARLHTDKDTTTLMLAFQVNWNVSTTFFPSSHSPYQRKFRQEMLATAYPELFNHKSSGEKNSCSPQMFYEAAHVPSVHDTPPENVFIPYMNSKLYPFQLRAVKWMLKREGVQWIVTETGHSTVKNAEIAKFDAPNEFIEIKDVDGSTFYVNQLLGKATKDPKDLDCQEPHFRGGVLSEEMGLGKTVELTALFSLHRQSNGPAEVYDSYLGENVNTTPATLIVVPNALKKQWLSELDKHAPGLRVMPYEGLSLSVREDENKAKALIANLSSQDVVVTTYNVLSNELDYALGEPERARRAPRKYHRPRSPLTQLRWWRVCLDEAQMIESGVSKAATLARLIPRVNAWGVTGTPVKDSVEDLRGLLLFLRYEPFASNIEAWNTLIQSHESGFRRLFNNLSLRHSKRLVRHEISIPAQQRYIINMPFTAVEEQHYKDVFREVAADCGLGIEGEPFKDDWDPEDPGVLEAMRTALDRLRQTALHPEVGTRNRRALGHSNGPMRTVAEVLDAMIEASQVYIRTKQRSLLMSRLTRGQIMENSPRVKSALELWSNVLKDSAEIVAECRENLKVEIEQAKTARMNANPSEDEKEVEDAIDESNTGKVGDSRRRLRSALEVQHKATFFVANAHFQIKSNPELTKPGSEHFYRLEKLEIEGYEQAKVVRREILGESRSKVLGFMNKIATSASNQSFAVIPDFQVVNKRGIESRAIVEGLEVLAGELNEQAEHVDDWREHVIKLLMKPLVDEEGEVEITGEEYEDSTKLMEEIVVYIQVLRFAIADREDALSGQTNELVKHEAKTSLRQAKEGDGPFPEKLIELFRLRERFKPRCQRSLRAAVSNLRALTGTLRYDAAHGVNRARMELAIVEEQIKSTQKHLLEHQKVASTMSQELDLFTSTMNARVEFYRQLQNVSDMVAPYEGPTTAAEEKRLLEIEASKSKRLDTLQSKHRYLLHLKNTDAADNESRHCVICRENFNVGVLTVCGHQFCKVCMTMWHRHHKSCPVCKRGLSVQNLHDITYKPQELKLRSEVDGKPSAGQSGQGTTSDDGHSAAMPKSRQSAIYKEFSAEKLAEIRNIDLNGPAFTTKVDNLIRHLLWLRENDPGAKSIIFSQYADFLSIIDLAFRRYHIGFTSFDRHNGITAFREDPSVECFLLHARAHASGLNLVNASHVFLMEPLVNTALELQAIARVDRIGQENETTVWLYIVDGTVEESIYNLSVRRRMEHMHQRGTKTPSRKGKGKAEEVDNDEMLEAANSMELEHASLSKLMGRGKRQGETVDQADLWECLFGAPTAMSRNSSSSGTGVGGSPEGGRRNNHNLNPTPAIRGFLTAEAAENRARLNQQQIEEGANEAARVGGVSGK